MHIQKSIFSSTLKRRKRTSRRLRQFKTLHKLFAVQDQVQRQTAQALPGSPAKHVEYCKINLPNRNCERLT